MGSLVSVPLELILQPVELILVRRHSLPSSEVQLVDHVWVSELLSDDVPVLVLLLESCFLVPVFLANSLELG